jgi:hypothetical protein
MALRFIRRGVAGLLNINEERLRRGWFAVNALKRLAKAEDKRTQWDKEKRYFEAHRQMGDRRARQAEIRDHMASLYGRKLGWYSVLGATTDAHCAHNHGKNFYYDRRPRGGFPGEVHPHCKCTPGAPWPWGITLRS